ncbi:MAG: Tn3 family transposase [Acidimicrobiales bacterium]
MVLPIGLLRRHGLRPAGFDHRPQLADLPDAKLWRIGPSTGYGQVRAATRGTVSMERVRHHWRDILRVVASVHTGAVSAHDAIRMLAHGENRPSSRRSRPLLTDLQDHARAAAAAAQS